MSFSFCNRSARVGWRWTGSATLVLAVASMLATELSAAIMVFEAGGAAAADVTPARDAFRLAVGGGTVPGAAGDFGGLRREINWDAVPLLFSDPNDMPNNFFNVNSPRGAVFSTPGTGFRVSANAGGAAPVLFGFPGDLQTFSPQKLFASVDSNITDIHFFVPGTATPATTSAFAAIFVDAEDANATLMEFFDLNQSLIFSRFAVATPNAGLSFLGGVADAGERIARVRITTPDNFILPGGGRKTEQVDFVVMDDFLYATPAAVVPEPGSIAILSMLSLILVSARRLRKR